MIVTHAHFDHVGTLDDYKAAKFHIQDIEMVHVTGRDMSHPRFRAAYRAEDVKNLIDLVYADRMVFHDGDVELAPGLEFVLIGGHARGQAILRVNTKRGRVILASDAVHLFEETDDERPFAVFYDLFAMIEGYRRINRMAGSRDLIVPGHDKRVTAAYPALEPGLILKLHEKPVW
jgi:glyoxylase-like metal-dependent hydrolase (beta-lactamase superfamily II)